MQIFLNRMTRIPPNAARTIMITLCVQDPVCAISYLLMWAHFSLGSGLRTVLESVFILNTCEMEVIIVCASPGKWEQWVR